MKVTVKVRSRLTDKVRAHVKAALGATLSKVSVAAVDEMNRVASQKLGSTAALYQRGLATAEVNVTEQGLSVEITDPTARALETGFPAFDMKPKLLASDGAKRGKNGPYFDVPFNQGNDVNKFPIPVREQVKAAVRREERAAFKEDREERNPLRVTGTYRGKTRIQQRLNAQGKKQPVKVQRKVGLFSDMLRTAVAMKKGTKATFATIRRVSAKSDPDAWWNPGFEGVHAIKAVSTKLKTMAKRILREELRARGVKVR